MPLAQPVSKEAARRNAEQILQLWKSGRDSLASLKCLTGRRPAALAYGSRAETLAKEAKRLGTNVFRAAKARRLAEQYTATEIKVVCRQVEDRRSRFSAAHMLLLVGVKPGPRRNKLMHAAIERRLSANELARAIHAQQQVRRPSPGRPPAVPTALPEVLVTLGALAYKWSRWTAIAMPRLPGVLKAKVRMANEAVDAVRTAVEQAKFNVRPAQASKHSRTTRPVSSKRRSRST